jgi:hypothetical protein
MNDLSTDGGLYWVATSLSLDPRAQIREIFDEALYVDHRVSSIYIIPVIGWLDRYAFKRLAGIKLGMLQKQGDQSSIERHV